MRLIDATALREVVISFQYTPTSNENERCVRAIDAAPTVEKQEPVSPVEEWAWYDCYKCGACGKLWGKTYEIERWNFCPWCGRAVKWDA